MCLDLDYTEEKKENVCYRLLEVTKKQPALFQSAPVSSMIIHAEGNCSKSNKNLFLKCHGAIRTALKNLCKYAKSLDSLSSAEQDFLLLKNVDGVLEEMKHTGQGLGGDLIQLAFRTTKHRQSSRLDRASKTAC